MSMSKMKPVDVWIHAVSLGEVNAATALIENILRKNLSVLVTTMTPTGSQRVAALFADRIQHQYLPYDLPFIVRRFYNAAQPKLGIIMETEIWPNLIHIARKRGIKLYIANGRISDGAFAQYMKLRSLFKQSLNELTGILAQSDHDAERFFALGARQEIISNAGNLKFDLHSPSVDNLTLDNLKKAWGSHRPVLLAASTHHNEEQQILSRLNKLKNVIPDIVLLIAPRHPDRFKTVYQQASEMGFITGLRSNPQSINDACDVIVLDSLGELSGFYQVCDYAFVGGSLVPIGGHNVLEPIAFHVPVFTGPNNQNSKSIIQSLEEMKAIHVAPDADSLVTAIINFHQNQALCDEQVKNADRVLGENKGSLLRHLEIMQIESIFHL